MLIEYDKNTFQLISASWIRTDGTPYTQDQIEIIASMEFEELPENSLLCFTFDAAKAKQIWEAHLLKYGITIVVDANGSYVDALIAVEGV